MTKIISLAQARGSLHATAIFLHGLGGHPLTTWTSDQAGEIWPHWLAADVDGLAVRSVGYEASVSRWRGTAMHLPDRANNLLGRLLIDPDLASGELILVGHSLGGLVIKSMLRRAEASARDDARAASFLERARKVAFLATPHAGADLAEWGDRLRILLRPSAATAGLLRNDPHLRELTQWYRGFARNHAIEHLILAETRAMRIFGTIVKPDSADPGLEADPIPIDATHVDIVKPADRDSDVYRHVRDFVARRSERPVSREERKIDEVAVKLDGLPDEVAARVVEAMATRGGVDKAEAAGLERRVILMLAKRLKPEEAFDFDQAIVELERAVEIALVVIERGNRGTNEEQFVVDVRARLAELTKQGAFHEGARVVDAALAELDRRRAEKDRHRLEEDEMERHQRRALLEAGVEQDMLRRDAISVARRIEEIAAWEHPGELPAWTKIFREFGHHYHMEGKQKGVNFSLEIAIALARRLAETALEAKQKADAMFVLGIELSTLGERESGASRLEEAVFAFREALKVRTRDIAPLDWAETQNSLGNALQALGARESGTERLKEAVVAFREALKECSRDRVPLDWAMTQNNLGNALTRVGERESATGRLEEAVAAYREALKEYMRERVPLDWAMTQNNLGNALRILGTMESGTRRLDEAVAACSEALKERTREHDPLAWAATQNNLGAALSALGERENGTEHLKEAVAAYREALTEYTRDRVPLNWAVAQNNLGNALAALGERESGTGSLEAAVGAFREALKERTRERVPLDWAATQNNLGDALRVLGWREGGTGRLDEAVTAFSEALKERTRDRVPLDWAKTQNNLGNALRILGERESGTARLEAAVAAFREALKELKREPVPLLWAATQSNLGIALCVLGERGNGMGHLDEAVVSYREALTVFTFDKSSYYFEGTQRNLSRALALLEQRRNAGGG